MFTSKGSICDRLKQRYGNFQQDWPSLFQIQEKNLGDLEFVQYIVNYIIEQSKHNIVLSELPDVIQTLHCETDAILRKNKMITLEEVITQVQMTGAMKYPYLRKLKPITVEDFVKEVLREVFHRLGTMITLDMIENVCQFITCSAKQLLLAMPTIDVDEAATLIIEDISRNPQQGDVLKKTRSLLNLSMMNRKLEGMPISMNKERMRSENDSSRFSKTQLQDQHDIPIRKNQSRSTMNPSSSHRSSRNVNKNQIHSSEKQVLEFQESNSHFTQTIMENTFDIIPRHKSTKTPKSTNMLSSTSVPFDISSTKEHPQIGNSIQEQTKNQKEEVRNTSTANLFSILKNKLINREKNQKIKLSKSKSNTQTYSIHSEEGFPTQSQKPTATSMSNINDNAITDMFIKPTRSMNRISRKIAKQISSHPAPSTNISSSFNEGFHSPVIEAIHTSDLKKLQSIRHYNNDDEKHIIDNDGEKCPLEDIVNRRFIHQI